MGGTLEIGNIQGLERLLGIKVFRPRSSSVICVNENQPKSLYRTIEFGQRMRGDFILRTKKVHVVVSPNTELPRYLIEFKDDGLVLTSVLIKLNVSQINIPTVTLDNMQINQCSLIFSLLFYCRQPKR